MSVRLLLPLLLSGCAVQMPLCTTRCGLAYMGTSPERRQLISCADVQRAEDTALRAFAEAEAAASAPDPNLQGNLCPRLARIEWWQHADSDAGTWAMYREPIRGIAWCGQRMFATHAGDAWAAQSFPHELAHLLQNCITMSPTDPGLDARHSNWGRGGVEDALARYVAYAGEEP